MAKKKKPSVRAAKNACDRMFSEIVRSQGKCRFCGTPHNLQAAHIIRRSYNATRVDFDNVFCLCARDHMRFHREPDEWMAFVYVQIGSEEYARLKAKAVAGVGVKVDWFAQREKLKAIHKLAFA